MTLYRHASLKPFGSLLYPKSIVYFLTKDDKQISFFFGKLKYSAARERDCGVWQSANQWFQDERRRSAVDSAELPPTPETVCKQIVPYSSSSFIDVDEIPEKWLQSSSKSLFWNSTYELGENELVVEWLIPAFRKCSSIKLHQSSFTTNKNPVFPNVFYQQIFQSVKDLCTCRLLILSQIQILP